jgi:hypothetical protein
MTEIVVRDASGYVYGIKCHTPEFEARVLAGIKRLADGPDAITILEERRDPEPIIRDLPRYRGAAPRSFATASAFIRRA